jgi:hypothetical protein
MACPRKTTLLEQLRQHLNAARRVSQRPRTGGLRRFQRGDDEERPLLGNDSLILQAGWNVLDERYVIGEPESGRVWKGWVQPSKRTLSAPRNFTIGSPACAQLETIWARAGVLDDTRLGSCP